MIILVTNNRKKSDGKILPFESIEQQLLRLQLSMIRLRNLVQLSVSSFPTKLVNSCIEQIT